MDKWKSDATKALYASKMATMKAWFRAHPELGAITADGELVVPVSKDSLIAFLGAVTDYEEAAGGSADSSAGQKRKKPLALSTVQGYGSALKAYLNEQGCVSSLLTLRLSCLVSWEATRELLLNTKKRPPNPHGLSIVVPKIFETSSNDERRF